MIVHNDIKGTEVAIISHLNSTMLRAFATAAPAPDIVTITGRENVLRIYRQMLRLASRLPDVAKREDTARIVRSGFKENSGVVDQEKLAALLREAESKVGFLKIVTPRAKVGSGGETRVVFRGGKEVEGIEGRRAEKAAHTNWDGKNMDPDSVSRHHQTLKRAGFSNHMQVQGPWGF
ncbi:unnamed protein product [Choristocarpus tenellus]